MREIQSRRRVPAPGPPGTSRANPTVANACTTTPRTTRDCGGHQVDGRPDEVRSCLDSVVRSSYRNIEILVLIDGASRSIAAVLRILLAGIRVSGSWTSRWARLPDPDQHAERPLPHGDRLLSAWKKAVATLVKVLG